MTTAQPIIGFKDVKYGLNKPSEIQKRPGLFSAENDDAATRQQKEDQYRAKKEKKTQQQFEDILAKDPYAFAFDEVLPEMKKMAKKNVKKQEDTEAAKYVPSLLSAARERERSNNVLYQRKLHRELEEDRKVYGEETEKFLTANYKKQLEENRKFEEEERISLEEENKNDITKKGQHAWGSFYRNVLEDKNIAIGGETKNSEQSIQKLTGKKRSRSSSRSSEAEADNSGEEKDRDRRRRNRQRAEIAVKEAEKIREAR